MAKKAKRRYTDTEVRLMANVVNRLELTRKGISQLMNEYEKSHNITRQDAGEVGSAIATLYTILDGDTLTGRAGLVDLEKIAIKGSSLQVGVETVVNGHPMGAWVSRQVGIGEKQFGRWYGAVTSEKRKVKFEKQGVLKKGQIVPASNLLWFWDIQTGEWVERTYAKLWRHCGLDVTDEGKAPRRVQGGGFGHWNNEARMRAILMADQVVKVTHRCDECKAQKAEREKDETGWLPPADDCYCDELGHKYLDIYDRERLKWLAEDDKADLFKAHHHRHALRVVAKRIVRDAFQEAKRLEKEGLYWSLEDLIADWHGNQQPELNSLEEAMDAWT